MKGTFGDPDLKKCVKSCQFNYYADNTTRMCTQSCNSAAKLYKDASTKQCVLTCPSMPKLYNDPTTYSCVAKCPSNYFRLEYKS